MHTPISVVIITKNEEKNIGRCLQSVVSVADEIVIVDSYSTDKTISIAESFNAKIVQQEWLGYGAQKNFANKIAKHQWILSLDADEELSNELIQSILYAKKNGLYGQYEIRRITWFYGKFVKYGLEKNDFKIRLFPKDIASWNLDLVHENLVTSQPLEKQFLKGELLHYSYYSIQEHIERINQYSYLSAQKYFLAGKKGAGTKMIFSPLLNFFKSYILKAGFLDGRHGFILSIIHSFEAFLRYSKLWDLQRKNPNK